jgi:poly(A) polymerase
VKLPDAGWTRDPDFARLVAGLGAEADEVRVVGGAVRDTLLGASVTDLDLATVHPPLESKRRVEAAGYKAVPTGIAHGTVTAVLPSGPVEVTTLRRDVETDGRHAQVAFTDDWREDAARRDFTINALFADPLTLEVQDYFGGLADLEAGLVRFIGDPLERIAEDHLRILRFFRFQARFGRGEPDAAALDACTARANDLMALSRERIAQELLKLLKAEDPVPAVRLMIERRILAPILPEVDAGGVARLGALVAVEAVVGRSDPVRRLSALLPTDSGQAERIGARLKLSNAQRKRLAVAAETGLPEEPRALAYRVGIESARDRLLLQNRADALSVLDDWTPPRLPIAGGALIALGLPQGVIVAKTLAVVEQRWVEEGFPGQERVEAIAAEEVKRALT